MPIKTYSLLMPKMFMSKIKIIIFVQMPRQTKLNEECGSVYNEIL